MKKVQDCPICGARIRGGKRSMKQHYDDVHGPRAAERRRSYERRNEHSDLRDLDIRHRKNDGRHIRTRML